jgi:hypothetical protein
MSSASHLIEYQPGLAERVFADLLEKDLLGFVLSPVHLVKHLLHMTASHDPHLDAQVQQCIDHPACFAHLHQALLDKAEGFYIAEAALDDNELMEALDCAYDNSWTDDQLEVAFLDRLEHMAFDAIAQVNAHAQAGIAMRRFFQTAGWSRHTPATVH